jgi:molybdopterin-guanine dinucleotide biosynthesis protein A
VALCDDLTADLLAGQAAAMGRWLARREVASVSFEETPDPFFNVNTPADLAAAALR